MHVGKSDSFLSDALVLAWQMLAQNDADSPPYDDAGEFSLLGDRYHQLLSLDLAEPLPIEEAVRHARAAAVAFFRAGVVRHKLLLLQEIMERFDAKGDVGDPPPVLSDRAGKFAYSDSHKDAAERHYAAAVALAPDFAEALYNLAVLARASGDREKALRLFRLAAGARPHPGAKPHSHFVANALWNVATLQRELGLVDAAIDSYMRALNLLDNFGVHHLELATFLHDLGRLDEAAMHYERIMPYSHLYAAEFVEPNYAEDERQPLDPAGNPLSPFAATMIQKIDGRGCIYYWWHLYLLVPHGSRPIDAATLERSWLSVETSLVDVPLRRVRRWRTSWRLRAATSLEALHHQIGMPGR